MIHYPNEWMADRNNEDGLATYWVDGTRYTLKLASFEDFQRIGEMLSAADLSGRKWMKARVTDLMDSALAKVKST